MRARNAYFVSSDERFARDRRSSLSIPIGREAGEDIVAMVTVERVVAHLEWHALIWRGPLVWMEISGSCADMPEAVGAQIRNRIAECRVKGKARLGIVRHAESCR